MSNFTTESPLSNNNEKSSNNSSSGSSSPCLPSSSNFTFSTVEDIIQINPALMKNLLSIYNLKNCNLKNGYCSQIIDTTSGCLLNTPNPTDSECSCDCLLFPLNLMNSLSNTIYCTLTNTKTTNFVLSNQTIIFSLIEQGGNISNANLNTSQTANVNCVSISSSSVQKNIADISYQVILNIIQQSKTQPSLFSCPISQDFLKMYQEYDTDELNNIVQSNITSTISSFVQDAQTITISLEQVEFQKLSANITQEQALTILTNNIVNQSFNKINQSVLGQHFEDIMNSFNNYCSPPTTQPPEFTTNPPLTTNNNSEDNITNNNSNQSNSNTIIIIVVCIIIFVFMGLGFLCLIKRVEIMQFIKKLFQQKKTIITTKKPLLK